MADYPTQNLGVTEDPRTEVAKAQDWRHEEVAAGVTAGAKWKEKPRDKWRRYVRRYQAYSSSCMAHSGVKVLGVENVPEEGSFVELSALPVYRARSNYPYEGMFQQNTLDLLCKPTACSEAQMPSMGMTEEAMNRPLPAFNDAMRATAELYRANGYIFLEPGNIDAMAELIEKGKAIHLIMFFTDEEYWRTIPKIIEPGLTRFDAHARRHGIAAVDYTLKDGKKALVIDDSAGPTSTFAESGQRLITEDFLKARCYGAGYLIERKNAPLDTPKPKHTFTVPLFYGLVGDPEVAAMQKVLQYEGHLALTLDGAPLPLGNFYSMTAGALKKWQVKHGITDFANEPDVRKIRFGPKSIQLANTLYA
jgi:hypothetical protein